MQIYEMDKAFLYKIGYFSRKKKWEKVYLVIVF